MMESNRSRGGRPRDSFADPHVVPVENHEGNVIAKKCIYCDHQFSIKTSVTRIKAHLGGVPGYDVALCIKVPPNIKEAAKSAMPSSGTSSRPRRRMQVGPPTVEALQDMEQWLLSSPQDGENHFGHDMLTAPEITDHGLGEDPNCFPHQAMQQDDLYEDLEGLDPATNSLSRMSIETQQTHQHRTSESFSLVPRPAEHLLTEVRQEVPEMQPCSPQPNESCSMHNLTSQNLTQQNLGEDPPCTSTRAKREKKRKLDKSPPIGKRIPLATTFRGPTFNKKVAEIHASLEDYFASRIGVYGMGGSGKTTIMKYICNQLLEERFMSFSHVIWVTVSQDHSITRLRHHLASRFNVILPNDEDEVAQAASLYEGMQNKCYALILDDVWDKINLEEVGIPEPSRDNGCKLILTTRSLDVCRRMQCKPIYLDLLLAEEAWELFVKTLGIAPRNSIIECIMREVTKECACLPLAIVTIAGSMRGVFDVHEWRVALDSLRFRTFVFTDMEKEVMEKLKFSFYRLSKQLQECLLVCALYPEDFMIYEKDLIKLLIFEGTIGSTESLLSAYDHGYTILNKLENACLLTQNEFKGVIMHDLVRDMCLNITRGRFLVKCCSKFPPDNSKYTEDVEKVSLMWSEFEEIPSHIVPYCPKLSMLVLSHSWKLTRIPCSFFRSLPSLQVLNLSSTSVHELPNSVTNLVSLNALVLRRCSELRRLPCLATLKALKNLDLFESGIEEVPEGLGELVHLTYFDLNETNIRTLPNLILRNLVKLQYLHIGWIDITIEDVKELKNLESFQATFAKMEDFNEYVSFLLNSRQGPRVYEVRVSYGLIKYGIYRTFKGGMGITVWGERDERQRNITPTELTFPQDVEIIIPSREFVERLEINDLEEDSHVLSELLSELERVTSSSLHMSPIRLHHKDKTEEIGQSKGLFDAKLLLVFPKLQDLEVNYCAFMGELISTSSSVGVFNSSLKYLDVYGCDKLVRLVAPGFLHCIQNLKHIRIYKCASLERMISTANPLEEEENDNAICFPKLWLLVLADLPNLRSICDGICPSIQHIHVRRCPKLKRLPLQLQELDDNGGRLVPLQSSLKVICGERTWWESLEWDHPHAKILLQPYFKPCLRNCYADPFWSGSRG